MRLKLTATEPTVNLADELGLRSCFENDSDEPVKLVFWWNRRFEIRDEQGELIAPGKGPTLPCGKSERVTQIAPGASFERDEGLVCTQPGGSSLDVGWRYELGAGNYTLKLIYEWPSPSGFGAGRKDGLFVGRLESEPLWVTIGRNPPDKVGVVRRMLGL